MLRATVVWLGSNLNITIYEVYCRYTQECNIKMTGSDCCTILGTYLSLTTIYAICNKADIWKSGHALKRARGIIISEARIHNHSLIVQNASQLGGIPMYQVGLFNLLLKAPKSDALNESIYITIYYNWK